MELRLWVSIDQGVMERKGYSTLPRALELEPDHQMQFSVIARTPLSRGSYPAAVDTEYSKFCWQGFLQIGGWVNSLMLMLPFQSMFWMTILRHAMKNFWEIMFLWLISLSTRIVTDNDYKAISLVQFEYTFSNSLMYNTLTPCISKEFNTALISILFKVFS